VIIKKDGEPIVHNVGGGGVLRIDAPPPPKANSPAPTVAQAAPAPEAAKAAPPKPMSRLEKLRAEARERAKR
jgi:hypothetical protein